MTVKHPIEILLRAKYDRAYYSLSSLSVVIVHRGAPNDEKTIDGSKITDVGKTYFEYKSGKGITHIPAHRIKRVIKK
jgi:uncharacterized protein (UPF0248 family)